MKQTLAILALLGLIGCSSAAITSKHSHAKRLAQTLDRPWTADIDLNIPFALDYITSDHEAQGDAGNCIYSRNHPLAFNGVINSFTTQKSNFENRFMQMRDNDKGRTYNLGANLGYVFDIDGSLAGGPGSV